MQLSAEPNWIMHACMNIANNVPPPPLPTLPAAHCIAGRTSLQVLNSACSMFPSITFTATATSPDKQPTLPRSGACAATLPPSHSHDVILFGGYTEQQSPSMVRVPTNEAWLFSSASGSWSPVQYSSEAVPSTRLVAQCVVVGNKLWLIGEC
jgi:hypothetical protein